MARRTLGLDLGTNSIGWAIVEKDDAENVRLIDYGSHIFQEGVAREKNIEKPKVQDRTNARALRRLYDRRRLRKIDLLKILNELDMCPKLSDKELDDWRYKRIYPMNEDFIFWQRTDDKINKNPYYDRYLALTTILDLSVQRDRYILGRALYHLTQRRGFKSNRNESTPESDGTVAKGINELNDAIKEAGCEYLGEYFYKLYAKHGKIRTKYTDRIAHTEKELLAICTKQGLREEVTNKLRKAIVDQRPLKSQKGLVGKCVFEPTKSRCLISHPLFEEFRMWSFINNIKISGPGDKDIRPLNEEELNAIIPLFYRKSKSSFEFEDIAKKIARKAKYGHKDDKGTVDFKFNFHMSHPVSGCPVTAALMDLFGNEYKSGIAECYDKAEGKSIDEIVNDVWHVLYSFDRDDLIEGWAYSHLQLSKEDSAKFAKIKLPQGYASLSLCAIKKILPYLKSGMRYDEAVFVGNLQKVLPEEVSRNPEMKEAVIEEVCDAVVNYADNPLKKTITKEQAVKNVLEDINGLDFNKLKYLYHPSCMDVYAEAELDKHGKLRLGSPRTDSIRNPMAMHALFRLRHLINQLLEEGKIDRTTFINIELSRELNDSNMRQAIQKFQRENEKTNLEAAENINTLYKEATSTDINPTETDILKYKLWKEQDSICLYTGNQISITDFIGPNPRYDIEHTVPRSLGGDSTQANLTLCERRFNRSNKCKKLPSLLAEYDEIMARIDSLGWEKKIGSLRKQADILRAKSRRSSVKELKDKFIQDRHVVRMKLDYWTDKLNRFTMTQVPEGFSRRQGTDTGIIGKYAREYLKTLFRSEERQVFNVKGSTIADFRKMWGLQDDYAKKERINHCHHAVDAIVIACIGRAEYQKWAEFRVALEDYELGMGERPVFPKPWPTFTEDVKSVSDHILVSHHTSRISFKQTKKILKKHGKKVRNAGGSFIYEQGNSLRGQLHNDTFYGKILADEEEKVVIRRELKNLPEKDIKNIVDSAVRAKIEETVKERGFKNLCSEPVWMNKEKGIEIKKVRIFKPSFKPVELKSHRDKSRHEHKQSYLIEPGNNYCLCIYEGKIGNKLKRTYKLISFLEATNLYKSGQPIFPAIDEKGLPIKWQLRTGDLVLFYEKSPDEVYNCTKEELVKRLYKVTILSRMLVGSGYGTITLRYHQEARPATDSNAKSINGIWKQGETIRSGIIQLHTQFNALVEGQDFILTETGEIHFLHKSC